MHLKMTIFPSDSLHEYVQLSVLVQLAFLIVYMICCLLNFYVLIFLSEQEQSPAVLYLSESSDRYSNALSQSFKGAWIKLKKKGV